METDKDSWLRKEKEKWQKKAEVDLRERIQKEQKEWEEKAELDVLERIQAEKVNRGVMVQGYFLTKCTLEGKGNLLVIITEYNGGSWVKAVFNQKFIGGKG